MNNNESLPSASASGSKTIPLKFIPVDENTQYIVVGKFFSRKYILPYN